MKNLIEHFLLKVPLIYKLALFFKKNSNPDKLIFTKYVKLGDTVVDCGANIGLYTNFLRLLIGKHGFVHSFEPIPKTFEELNFNTKQHSSINNYRLNMMGLYDRITSSSAFIPNEISGHASLGNHSETWKTDSIQKVSIDLTTLDDYFDKHNLKAVHFIKMDIEGAEQKILSDDNIDWTGVDAFVMEWHHKNFGKENRIQYYKDMHLQKS